MIDTPTLQQPRALLACATTSVCSASDSDNFTNLFAQESTASQSPTAAIEHRWKVLLVDDEDDMHTVLHMALKDMEVEGFPLELYDARSADEAKKVLAEHPDISLILLDVVMETEMAGLSLVTHVRQEICNRMVQIVLVTGQPGYAQEHEVRADYDINGYRLKSELTAYNIYTSVSLALRAYQTLRSVKDQRCEPVEQVNICLDDAIEAHRQWREKLKVAAATGEPLDAASLRRNDCCDLGKWIHAKGRQLYGSKPEFVKLMARHNDFHLVASMVANSINDREYTDLQKVLNGNSQFAQASLDVETAVMTLKFSLSN